MDVTIIAAKPYGRVLSALDEEQRRRFMAFARPDDARKCIKYVSSFRASFGYWPECDLSLKGPAEIKTIENFKRREPADIERLFYTFEFQNSTVDELCAVYNIPLLLVHSFDFHPKEDNQFEVHLSAQHLNCTPDQYRYVAKLNEILSKD